MKQCQDPNVKVAAPKIEAALIAVTVAGVAYSLLGQEPTSVMDSLTDVSESISSGAVDAVDAELLTGVAAAASGLGGQVFRVVSEVLEGLGVGVRELLDNDIKKVVDKIIERFLD